MTAQLGLNYFGGNLFAQPYIVYQTGSILTYSLVDSLGLTDDSSASLSIMAYIVDNVGLTDSNSRISHVVRQVLESVGITDSVSRSSNYNVYVTDLETLADMVRYSGRNTDEIPKLLNMATFKPTGDISSSKSKLGVIVVRKASAEMDL